MESEYGFIHVNNVKHMYLLIDRSQSYQTLFFFVYDFLDLVCVFVTYGKNSLTMKWPSLLAKKWKNSSSSKKKVWYDWLQIYHLIR